MLNNRKYTDKENIDYILLELDERFDTARAKLEQKLNAVYADPQHPLEFPPQFKAHPQLSINIMNLIPHSERAKNDYNNHNSTVNKVSTRNNQRNLYQKKDRGMVRHKTGGKSDSNHWSKNIKWEFMPGAVCSACGQNNYEIYQTGCPAMAIFCHCKAFYDKTDPKHY